ncbi:hypothetical protein BCR42DRAFT_401904 [Absidia repens]|uniref:Uncharacterized protein n=1 Tax=Absidia repens TaxID=90262 RepID=A0A1X2IXC3_9FUNG|nr:hypothetical protein BCR42DRAFT_401904 [Absidia repens]
MFLVGNGDLSVGSSGHSVILEWIGELLVTSTLVNKAIMDFGIGGFFLLSDTVYNQTTCWFAFILLI